MNLLLRDLHTSLTSILANVESLGRGPIETRPEGDPRLELIRRETRRSIDLVVGALEAVQAQPGATEDRPRSNGTGYLAWARTRLMHLERGRRADQQAALVELVGDLRSSASSMGYVEIASAAEAVRRLSSAPNASADAGFEILRRVIKQAIRRAKHEAA